jgi:hypothetical protein
MSTDPSNSASDTFGTGPASRYILNFLIVFVVIATSTVNNAHVSVMNFVIIYLIFRIEMNRKLLLIPTS